jgi:hypothetical protein
VCVCVRAIKHYNVRTAKHNSCIFYYYVKMFSQKQHVSTQLNENGST